MKFGCVLGFVLGAGCALTQPFQSGNLVLVEVGDGVAGLSNRAAPVFLSERNPSDGSLVGSPLALSPGGANRLTLSGVATTEGSLSRTADGKFLVVGGYGAEVGTLAVAFTTSDVVRRVVARIDANGVVDKSTALSDAYSGGNFRSAYSLDGNGFWLAGTPGDGPVASGGIRYAAKGTTTSTQVLANPSDTRFVFAFQNQLYGCGIDRVLKIGQGLPVGSGASSLLQFPAGSSSPNDVVFVSPTLAYVADDSPATSGGGIQRWDYVGGVWSRSYTLKVSTTTGTRRIAWRVSGGGPNELFALTTEATQNKLVRVLDVGALSSFDILATAPARIAWRGIAFTPGGGGGSTRLLPASYTVVSGEEAGGSLESLWDIDGNVLQAFNDSATLRCEVEFEGFATGSFNRLEFVAVQLAERGGLAVSLRLFNFTRNRYETITGATASPTMTQLVAQAPNPVQSFVGAEGWLRARVVWSPINDEAPAVDGWLHGIDQANWILGD